MAQLDTKACTWKSKVNTNDTVVFGGDWASTGNPASAQSIERVAALVSTDYLELDFTFDTRTVATQFGIGFAAQKAANILGSDVAAAWVWDGDNALKAYENGVLRFNLGVITLPMSARIIYNAGVLTWRSNSGSDTLRFTSAKTVDTLVGEMTVGFQLIVSSGGSGNKLHATLKGGDASSPEVGLSGAGTGRLGAPTLQPQLMDTSSYYSFMTRHFEAEGFPPPGKPRPVEGKIWPRNY